VLLGVLIKAGYSFLYLANLPSRGLNLRYLINLF